jgi:pimeloyl-ACP methyl ester carboxylesterase
MKLRVLYLTSMLTPLLGLAACGGSAEPGIQELEASVPHGKLYVRVAGNPGSGNVMIALHGGPGQSHHYMLDLEKLAGRAFAVVTYDQRGVGSSTAPPAEPANYDLANYVEDLEAVRRAVGAEQVHLLGHSWGGVVAMHYATLYPENVHSLILAGSGSPTWNGNMAAGARIGQRIQALQREGVLPDPLPPGAEFMAFFSDPSFPVEHPDENAVRTEFNQTVNQLTWAATQGFDLTAEVGRLDHHMLVLFGEDDPSGMPLVEETLAALQSADVELVLLEKCGHFWHECPDQFYPRVQAFLGLAESQ